MNSTATHQPPLSPPASPLPPSSEYKLKSRRRAPYCASRIIPTLRRHETLLCNGPHRHPPIISLHLNYDKLMDREAASAESSLARYSQEQEIASFTSDSQSQDVSASGDNNSQGV